MRPIKLFRKKGVENSEKPELNRMLYMQQAKSDQCMYKDLPRFYENL